MDQLEHWTLGRWELSKCPCPAPPAQNGRTRKDGQRHATPRHGSKLCYRESIKLPSALLAGTRLASGARPCLGPLGPQLSLRLLIKQSSKGGPRESGVIAATVANVGHEMAWWRSLELERLDPASSQRNASQTFIPIRHRGQYANYAARITQDTHRASAVTGTRARKCGHVSLTQPLPGRSLKLMRIRM